MNVMKVRPTHTQPLDGVARRLHGARRTNAVVGWLPAIMVLFVFGCGSRADDGSLFVRHSSRSTGIRFSNDLSESTSFNIINYQNYYNGAGVAAGDVDGDGLADLYFASNEKENRLYLNEGEFQFDDVTETAGVAGEGNWTTGVTMADVNGDGRLDIYVSVVAGFADRVGSNQLYINEGVGENGVQFTERAEEYGLDFSGYGSHASFFDYDRDGDLDVYLVNHSTHSEGTFGNVALRNVRHERAGDRLMRNDGGRFVDVTEKAGIYGGVIGYGLSVTVRDFDFDGWPDIFVANDFHEDDFLYYNNGDGTFEEVGRDAFRQMTYSSMGSDAADVNNDGRTDLVVLDMLPEHEDVLKTSAPPDGHTFYHLKRTLGYHPQYPWNMLHLAEGRRRFSEIGRLAGIDATDWSWSPLLADLDSDGLLDLLVSNGIYRRPNDLDYIDYIASDEVQREIATDISAQALKNAHELIPPVARSNYAFRNMPEEGRGAVSSLRFENAAAAWGLDEPGFSNGTTYADLDNDGDLDLVFNDLNGPARVYENRSDVLSANRALVVALKGETGNTNGIGARVIAKAGSRKMHREAMPARGWMSSVDPRLHFGLGDAEVIDSLTVIWPDGRFEVRTNVPANQLLTLRQQDASGSYDYLRDRSKPSLFEPAASPDFVHEENDYFDFNRETLMPHRLSTQGPAFAAGDVNGDGLEDFYVGGAKWKAGALFLQQQSGAFARTGGGTWQADSLHEDVDAAFFDVEGDGDLDLYVVSGGNEFWGQSAALLDRLYLNDGGGSFTRAEGALPEFHENGGCVSAADYDGDGDVDLFVGSRVVAKQYGRSPRSYLLENDGTGRFLDVTAERAPELAEAGMVSDAVWTDMNGDGGMDLVVVGEWMPVTLYLSDDGRLVEMTEEAGLEGTNGWWNAVAAVDVDGDGDEDLVAGNQGLNTPFRTQPDGPLRLHVDDFDGDGSLDQMLTHVKGGERYPIATVDQLKAQMPGLAERYPTYSDFGARRLDEIVGREQLEAADALEVQHFATSIILNVADGGAPMFEVRPLPVRAQFAPVYGIAVEDLNEDGYLDLVLGGNFLDAEPTYGRFDASRGVVLLGDGSGDFRALPPIESGLWLEGQIRSLRFVRTADGNRTLLAVRNDEGLQRFRLQPPGRLASGL